MHATLERICEDLLLLASEINDDNITDKLFNISNDISNIVREVDNIGEEGSKDRRRKERLNS